MHARAGFAVGDQIVDAGKVARAGFLTLAIAVQAGCSPASPGDDQNTSLLPVDSAAAPTTAASSSDSVSLEAASIQILRRTEPAIAWDAGSVVSGDFTGDGAADIAAIGTTPDSAFLGIVSGVGGVTGPRILRFLRNADGQDSVYRYDRAGLLIALKAASAGRR